MRIYQFFPVHISSEKKKPPLVAAPFQVSLSPIPTSARSRSADSCPTTRKPNAAAAHVPAPEHGGIAQHVRDDEEAHMGAADVHLVEMRHAPVAGRDGDVLELDVHVIFGCVSWSALALELQGPGNRGWAGKQRGKGRNLPSRSLPRYVWPDVISSVTIWPCESVSWDVVRRACTLTIASLRSLIGMPIVDVILAACEREAAGEVRGIELLYESRLKFGRTLDWRG